MAAQALGLTLQSFAVSESEELDGAFAMMIEQRPVNSSWTVVSFSTRTTTTSSTLR